jgi:predicted metalloprotease with PDZ domain
MNSDPYTPARIREPALKPAAYPLLAAAFFLTAAKPPEPKPISYRVTPILQKDGTRALDVRMRFRGEPDGETELFLPSVWAGSSELWRHAKGLEIRGARSLGGTYDKPLARHRPGARLKVRYRIVSAYSEDPGFAYEKARPMVRPDWFFVHGESMFAVPGDSQERPARFRWGRLPKGWTAASDLDHLEGKPTTLANLVNSVAIGGEKLRVVRRDLRGAPLRVALLGDWQFTADQLADTVTPIIAAEDEFWGDRSSPYLVAMAPLGELPAGLSYHGTGRTDGFSIASTSAFELKQAVRFLAHENMHGWVPIALGGMPEEDEARDYWFSEGFNDYLASKVLLRSRIWTLAEWAADKNETLLRYGQSPAKTATGAEIAQRFWTDSAVQQVSYDRGHLLAAKLDSEIAARTGGTQSLETVLQAQRRAAEGSSELAVALFRKTLRDRTGIDIDPDLERYARRGEILLLPAGLLGDCARLVTERRKAFTRGYDADATRRGAGVISGVDREGPAYAAGLRDGMQLVRREAGKIGDASVELAYRVAEGGKERVISYMPEGKAEFEVQRVELTATGPEAQAACRTRLGGAS